MWPEVQQRIQLKTLAMLNLSNNQPIEAWHRTLMRRLKGALKGSTTRVLEHSFPKIIQLDSMHTAFCDMLYHGLMRLSDLWDPDAIDTNLIHG